MTRTRGLAAHTWVPIIPFVGKDERVKGPEIETINGQSFIVHPLKENERAVWEPDIVYYALDIPDEARSPLNADKQDHVLVMRQKKSPDQEGHGVLRDHSGQDFGHFECDDRDGFKFTRSDATTIGGEAIGKKSRVGYITALLKPTAPPPPRSPVPPPRPAPPANSTDSYRQLTQMVGDKGVADCLLEYERQQTPKASPAALIGRAIDRLRSAEQ